MSKTNKLAGQIKGHFTDFEDNHEKNMAGNNEIHGANRSARD